MPPLYSKAGLEGYDGCTSNAHPVLVRQCSRVGYTLGYLVVLVIFGYVPGYQTRIYTLRYPGIKPGRFGHSLIGIRVPPNYIPYPGH